MTPINTLEWPYARLHAHYYHILYLYIVYIWICIQYVDFEDLDKLSRNVLQFTTAAVKCTAQSIHGHRPHKFRLLRLAGSMNLALQFIHDTIHGILYDTK